MNLEFFIANRLIRGVDKAFSRFIIKIATIAIALSIAVMIISVATVTGFQETISKKIFGFWGHIHITHFDSNRSFETLPISLDQEFYPSLSNTDAIEHIQMFATKAGIIKTDQDIEGIVLKGVGPDYNWNFFREFLVDGDILKFEDSVTHKGIIISRATAKRLKIKTGDDLRIYFIIQRKAGESGMPPPRARRLTVTGIFNTGLEEYDRNYALVDIRHIQKLNNWDQGQVGGFEVFIKDVDQLDELGDHIYYNVIGSELYAQTVREFDPNIFDWLDLQDVNVVIILLIMIIVAVINMTTTLLILILERTNMIVILKALGFNDWSVRKIFLYNAVYIIGIGLFWGNLLGIGLCLIQQEFGLLTLPEESYYLSEAPVKLDWLFISLLNFGTMTVCLLVLIIPTWLIARIEPVRAIRFS